MTILQLETLDSLIAVNKDLAEKRFKDINKGEMFLPWIVGYTPDNCQRILIAGIFKDDEEKQKWFQTASLVFLLYGLDKYVVMTEAWSAKLDKDENIQDIYKKYGSLEFHPNRMEILSILAVNRNGTKISTFEIDKDRHLVPMPEMDSLDVRGRMCDLLPPSDLRPTAKEREILRSLLMQSFTLENT